jgi:hypothetical protein
MDVWHRRGAALSKHPTRNGVHPGKVRPDVSSRKRRWLVILHALSAAYVLPAFFLAGQPLVPHSFVGSYRRTAIGVVGVLTAIWSIAYWTAGFYPRIYRLSPDVQARTGAKVRINSRRIEWDRPVGWRASLGLQFRFVGLVLSAFALWGALLLTLIAILTFMQEGPAGVVKFLRGK